MSNERSFSVGYFPKSLPRDPRDIDMYLEHLAVGQVIETVLKVDDDGNLAPNLAKNWKISSDGKEFEFELNKGIYFSNKKELICKDVEYSLMRHLEANSQSRNYLTNIKTFKCIDNYNFKVTLKDPQVAFLKILTRDHLGILPHAWEFQENSNEPWIGTGPYRYIKNGAESYFLRNKNFRSLSEVNIERWNILESDDVVNDLKSSKVPDYVLHTPLFVKEQMIKDPRFANHSFVRPLHFIQSLIWWYPLGKNFSNDELKTNTMAIMNELVLSLNAQNNFELSTGVIPKGILGHLATRIELKAPHKFETKKELKVSVYASDYESFFGNDEYRKLEAKYNFKFVITKVLGGNNLPEKTLPDILIAGYAGGFLDPAGFLIVLKSILGVEPEKYLEEEIELYQAASQEQDWTERGSKFRKLNEKLVSTFKVVPAWKKDLYIGKTTGLIEESALFRYSLKLSKIKPK